MLVCRTLTDRQRAHIMSYAEDEVDVDGTVNGVTTTTTGEHHNTPHPTHYTRRTENF